MKGFSSKKLISGGIALSLLFGGSAMYAFADNGSTSAAQPPVEKKTDENGQHSHKWQKGHDEKGKSQILQNAADILGMKTDEVEAQLKSGKSLADIAGSKGISEADLISKLSAKASQRIDDVVKAGKITKDKADQIKKNMPERMKKLVEHKGPFHFQGKWGQFKGAVRMPNLDKLAGLIGISKDELQNQLKSGKSLAEVAQAKGISKDQLISKIKNELTPELDKFVSRKHGGERPSDGTALPSA